MQTISLLETLPWIIMGVQAVKMPGCNDTDLIKQIFAPKSRSKFACVMYQVAFTFCLYVRSIFPILRFNFFLFLISF